MWTFQILILVEEKPQFLMVHCSLKGLLLLNFTPEILLYFFGVDDLGFILTIFG